MLTNPIAVRAAAIVRLGSQFELFRNPWYLLKMSGGLKRVGERLRLVIRFVNGE